MYNITISNLAYISYNKEKKLLSIKFEQGKNISIEKINKIFSILSDIIPKDEELNVILDLNSNGIYNKEFRNFFNQFANYDIKDFIIINKNSVQNTILSLLTPFKELKKRTNIIIVKNMEEAIKTNNLSL